MKNITLFLFLFLSISAFAQSSKPVLVDDLVPEKYKISNNYFPIIKGSYLYSIYALSTSDFISSKVFDKNDDDWLPISTLSLNRNIFHSVMSF
ncbi:Uncharacterised protein [Sphingobacterium multivorum]|uniref:Uncharacterized protein n=1 Tax=Sphingobacterium multivorum TaxID=28454 RepID=A0A2X2JEI7_SPHMU|nr:Uncharacterised protein [Sphingobacterium multivorum]